LTIPNKYHNAKKAQTQFFKSPDPYTSHVNFENSCHGKTFKDSPNGEKLPNLEALLY